uniref:Uncharacterized protein n=1 Tax=Tetraselmis sp. GSL018 TaxID=582737 RepID=A0A061R8U3_9CHLO
MASTQRRNSRSTAKLSSLRAFLQDSHWLFFPWFTSLERCCLTNDFISPIRARIAAFPLSRTRSGMPSVQLSAWNP